MSMTDAEYDLAKAEHLWRVIRIERDMLGERCNEAEKQRDAALVENRRLMAELQLAGERLAGSGQMVDLLFNEKEQLREELAEARAELKELREVAWYCTNTNTHTCRYVASHGESGPSWHCVSCRQPIIAGRCQPEGGE